MTAPAYIEAWRQALPALGVEGQSPTGGVRFQGTHGLFQVVIDSDGVTPEPSWSVRCQTEGKVQLTALAMGAAPTTVVDRVLTGDTDFDDEVAVFGEELQLLARLTPSARVAIAGLVRAGATIHAGVVSLSPRAVRAMVEPDLARRVLDDAETALGEVFRETAEGVLDRLVARFEEEPHPGVRRRLEQVLRVAGRDPEAASKIALKQLEQSISAGGDAQRLFAKAGETVSRKDLIEFVRRKRPRWGVAFLLDRFTIHEAAEYGGIWVKLGLAEADMEPEHWKKLAEALPLMTAYEPVPDLLRVMLKRATDDAIAATAEFATGWYEAFDGEETMQANPRPGLAPYVITECLSVHRDYQGHLRVLALVATCADERSEQALLSILESRLDDRVKMSALQILASVGGQAARGPVEDMTKGLFRDADVKAVARKALEAIEGRHEHWVVGGLSVSEETGADGGLSAADDEGRLSEA